MDKRKRIRFLSLILFILVCGWLGQMFVFDIASIRLWFSQFPVGVSGLVYILLYVFSTTLIWLGPKDVVRIAGAIIFGGLVSTVFVTLAELVNAAILFHLSRRLGRDYVVERFGWTQSSSRKTQGHEGFLGLLALRMNPLFSFRLLDLGVGLSRISFKKYFYVSVIGTPVRVFWLQYILAATGERLIANPSSLITLLARDTFIMKWSTFYFLLVGVVTLAAGLERALNKKTRVMRS